MFQDSGCCAGYPWWVAFILGNEFCERYAYYGMRSILVLYLTYFIGFSNNVSVEIYHAFAALQRLRNFYFLIFMVTLTLAGILS